jgi:hypothetical protein
VADGDECMSEGTIKGIVTGVINCPTASTCIWFYVWSSNTDAFWVSECETDIYGMGPGVANAMLDVPKLKLARGMYERCQLSRDRFQTRFYNDLSGNDGK